MLWQDVHSAQRQTEPPNTYELFVRPAERRFRCGLDGRETSGLETGKRDQGKAASAAETLQLPLSPSESRREDERTRPLVPFL